MSTRPTLRSHVFIVVTAIVTQALCSYSEAFLGFFEVASQLFTACFREIVVTVFLLVDCVPKYYTLTIGLPWEICDFWMWPNIIMISHHQQGISLVSV